MKSRSRNKNVVNWFCAFGLICTLAAFGAECIAPPAADAAERDSVTKLDAALHIGTRLELLVDDHLLGRVQNLEQRLHHPIPQEIALMHDAAWEGGHCVYHSVFRDQKLYRMYYRGSPVNITANPTGAACYAESEDGVHWRKPDLRLVDFNGSNENNILFKSGPYPGLSLAIDAGHLAVFKDGNPDAPTGSRYKALVGASNMQALFALESADGIHWRAMHNEPILTSKTDGTDYFDSQNTAFWDSQQRRYRVYCRTWEGGVRGIRTATSDDFLHWSNFEPVEYTGFAEREHLYTNVVNPYPRAPQLLIGFPVRYIERGWSDSMRALPDLTQREERAKLHLRFGTALTESLLMTSHDGKTFHRWGEAFLRPGPERPGTWNYGQQYIAWSAVETASSLDSQLPELSLYATEGYWRPEGNVVRRYTLRLDGFVSMHADAKGGEFVTKPLTFEGAQLCLNFSTSAAGSIQVELQDAVGNSLPGFTLSESEEIFGDALNRRVTWKSGSDLSSLIGKTICVRFVLKDADLYAFQFKS